MRNSEMPVLREKLSDVRLAVTVCSKVSERNKDAEMNVEDLADHQGDEIVSALGLHPVAKFGPSPAF